MATLPVSNQSSLTVNVYDGTRRPFTAAVDVLYRVFDGAGTSKPIAEPMGRFASVPFNLPFHDNNFDDHRIVVTAKNWQQSGYAPVTLSPKSPTILDLMLLPNKPNFDFSDAGWDRIKVALPFLAAGITDIAGRDRYNDLIADRPQALAGLLNITSSMAQIKFPDGTGPLDYLKQVIWDKSLAQDRFYAYCDPKLKEVVKSQAQVTPANKKPPFVEEPNPGAFHKGATASWKQVRFDEANVQLTFHEGDTKIIDGVNCVVVEPDIDYYKDLIGHTILEVIPNTFGGGLTKPDMVYMLRWIVGRRGGGDFRPPYTIV